MKGFMVMVIGAVIVATFLLLLIPYFSTRTALSSQVTFVSGQGAITANNTVIVEAADEPEGRRRGLMNRTRLAPNAGMLFVFDGESIVYFWMKDTLIPLDMIFIDRDFRIVHIKREAQPCRADPCETFSSVQPVKYVVEVNAGYADVHNVREGDRVVISYQRIHD